MGMAFGLEAMTEWSVRGVDLNLLVVFDVLMAKRPCGRSKND
jgi:hypothetical protein